MTRARHRTITTAAQQQVLEAIVRHGLPAPIRKRNRDARLATPARRVDRVGQLKCPLTRRFAASQTDARRVPACETAQ
jgi:hypothetical protein